MAQIQLANALTILKGIGLVPELVWDPSPNYNSVNMVLSTSPPAGSLVSWGSTVTLVTSFRDDQRPSAS